jgi:hypothetical protein
MRWLYLILFALFCAAAFAQAPQTRHGKTEVRTVPDSIVTRMKFERDFLYANDSTYWTNQRREEAESGFERVLSKIGRSSFVRVLLYIFLATAIIFIAYQLTVVNNFFISSASRKKRLQKSVEDDSDISTNLDEKIRSAIDDREYRHAIRFMYLRTLKLLSENNFITLHARSTNQEYIRQMYKHNQLSEFRQLTRIYEYVWYGEFDPNERQFETIRNKFNQFNPFT